MNINTTQESFDFQDYAIEHHSFNYHIERFQEDEVFSSKEILIAHENYLSSFNEETLWDRTLIQIKIQEIEDYEERKFYQEIEHHEYLEQAYRWALQSLYLPGDTFNINDCLHENEEISKQRRVEYENYLSSFDKELLWDRRLSEQTVQKIQDCDERNFYLKLQQLEFRVEEYRWTLQNSSDTQDYHLLEASLHDDDYGDPDDGTESLLQLQEDGEPIAHEFDGQNFQPRKRIRKKQIRTGRDQTGRQQNRQDRDQTGRQQNRQGRDQTGRQQNRQGRDQTGRDQTGRVRIIKKVDIRQHWDYQNPCER